jgi:GDP-fucose protein O-fucosyltransferase
MMVRPLRQRIKAENRKYWLFSVLALCGICAFVVFRETSEATSDLLLSSLDESVTNRAPPPSDQHHHHHSPAMSPLQLPPQELGHRVAGLVCDEHGGPSKKIAQEMIYWRDIPVDAAYQSPFAAKKDEESEELFFTFEPDEGGWNNIRMAMETAVALAVSMGRTLVLPPKMRFYLLWHGGSEEKDTIGFSDFYHVDSIKREHSLYGGLKVITFQEFLEQQALTGKILDPRTGEPSFPPENRTDWNGNVINHAVASTDLWKWVRHVTTHLPWSYETCVVAMPAQPGKEAADGMPAYLQQVVQSDQEKFGEAAQQSGQAVWKLRRDSYNGRPTPVDAAPAERLAELLANRNTLCVYDENLQKAKIVHVLGEQRTGYRLLIHFYAFLFFEDWKQDVWIKRFIRDHFRYVPSAGQ